MRPDWRIYYDDLSSFDSNMGEPHEAPTEGFICAVGWDTKGKRYIQHGWPFFFWSHECQDWWGCDLPGLLDNLRRNNMHAYKEGRTVPNETFRLLMAMADQDADFPPGVNREEAFSA